MEHLPAMVFFVFFLMFSCNSHHQKLRLIHILDSPESPLFNESRSTKLAHLIRMDEARHSRPSHSSWATSSASTSWAKSPVQSGITLGLGQYLVTITFGTPPQTMLLIADTGSDLVWLQCTTSVHHSSSPKFMSPKSSSFSAISCNAHDCSLVPAPPRDAVCVLQRPCSYVYDYADGSRTTGFLAHDAATLGSSTMVASSPGVVTINNVAFGCGTRNAGSSFAGAGGVLGMGAGELSFTSQSGYLFGHTFSYCLMDFVSGNAAVMAAESPTASSFLYMGRRESKNPNPRLSKNPNSHLAYTRMISNPLAPTFYYVRVQSLRLAGRRLPISSSVWTIDAFGNGGTIVDSGSTLSYLRLPAFLALVASIERASASRYLRRVPSPPAFQGLEPCFNVSGMDELEIDSAMPTLEIELDGGVLLQPPVENYFVDVAFDVKCLGVRPTLSPFGFNVVGNLMQQGYHVEFDRAASRIGFAHTNCQD